MIGFEKLLYFVEESEGVVVVTVGVQSGSLSGEAVVQLTTNSDTATGQCMKLSLSFTYPPIFLQVFYIHLSSLTNYLSLSLSLPARGDFTPVTQLLSFSSTTTQTSVSIPIQDDKNTEVMEQFFVSLSFGGNANMVFNPMTAVVMIDDDDSKFRLIS